MSESKEKEWGWLTDLWISTGKFIVNIAGQIFEVSGGERSQLLTSLIAFWMEVRLGGRAGRRLRRI